MGYVGPLITECPECGRRIYLGENGSVTGSLKCGGRHQPVEVLVVGVWEDTGGSDRPGIEVR